MYQWVAVNEYVSVPEVIEADPTFLTVSVIVPAVVSQWYASMINCCFVC